MMTYCITYLVKNLVFDKVYSTCALLSKVCMPNLLVIFGPMVSRIIGLSDYWSFGLLVFRTIGFSDQWCVGILGCPPIKEC